MAGQCFHVMAARKGSEKASVAGSRAWSRELEGVVMAIALMDSTREWTKRRRIDNAPPII
jgi:hypothetical protein